MVPQHGPRSRTRSCPAHGRCGGPVKGRRASLLQHDGLKSTVGWGGHPRVQQGLGPSRPAAGAAAAAEDGRARAQGCPLPSAAQVVARLRASSGGLTAAAVTTSARLYTVAVLFPSGAEAAAAAAHLRANAAAFFGAPQARACAASARAGLESTCGISEDVA